MNFLDKQGTINGFTLKLFFKFTPAYLINFNSFDDSLQEVIELRTQLDAERKKNKDLSMNVVKLNGIIKTGQDALSQEQGLVKKLQESLDSKSMVNIYQHNHP